MRKFIIAIMKQNLFTPLDNLEKICSQKNIFYLTGFTLIIAASLLSSFSARGQGLQAGVKGSLNSTWLFNNNVSDAAAKYQTYVPSFGQSYGVSGALYFSKVIGVEMNFLYSTHRQKYTGDSAEYDAETYFNVIEVPLLLKLKSSTGAYLEIGGVYGLISNVTYSYEDPDALVDIVRGPNDISDKFAKNTLDGMIGLGVDIKIGLGLSLTTAMRFWGSFTDLKGVDALGRDLSDQVNLDLYYNGKYQPTHSASAGFLLGLTYSIGKIAKD